MTYITHYTITINDRHGLYDIKSDGLIYSDMISRYGMQCNHHAHTVEYEAIRDLCEKVIDAIRYLEAEITIRGDKKRIY